MRKLSPKIIGVSCLLAALLILWLAPRAIPPEPDDQLRERVPDVAVFEGPRSGRWPAVRHAHIEAHPRCEACGSRKELNVHHLRPFHLHPELELEPTNLITLCRKHHFGFGHDGNWADENPACLKEVLEYRRQHPWK